MTKRFFLVLGCAALCFAVGVVCMAAVILEMNAGRIRLQDLVDQKYILIILAALGGLFGWMAGRPVRNE